MNSTKIAFIAQPIDPVIPPRQNSIGIIIYEIARRLVGPRSVTIYANRNANHKRVSELNGLTFRFFSTQIDQAFIKFFNRILDKLPRCLKPKLPFYACTLYYLSYIIKVSLELRSEQFHIAHVINFSQFIPVIRAFNPKIKIILHMECEWLSQLHKPDIQRRLRKTDLIVGCSEFITNKIRERFPFTHNICHSIYNGVDPNLFDSEKRRGNREKERDTAAHRLLFVGRGSPEKGVHVLLDALRIIIADDPSVQLQLVGFFGSAPPKEFIVSVSNDPKVHDLEPYYDGDYRSFLNSKLSSGLINHVDIKGVVSYADEPSLYRGAHVFVFPSVWHEPFGMPVIEAMSCGLPVVSTRSGGITELVEDGKTGLLVERGDSQMLADAIMRLLRDDPLRELMGKAGRKRVLERFTWDKIAEGFLTLYKYLYYERA
ncbi:MAG: glycosyltransferase family 4 protein [Thermodesulfobacteriota bacterium]|nr:glycosyltransferase family 4 protein [Thermodesulfobacteriota bacterium]